MSFARKVRAAHEHERDLIEQHAEERSRLESELREQQQQLVGLNAVHGALEARVAERLEAFERDRASWRAEQQRIASELESAGGWCSDQQDLLYRIRQQMAAVFSLLDGQHHLLGPRPVAPPPLPAEPATSDATEASLSERSEASVA